MSDRSVLTRWWSRLRYIAKQPIRDQLLMVQAVVLLGIGRAAILRFDYRRLERFMGTRLAESTRELSEEQQHQARRVAVALRRVNGHTPWTSNCFPQALAGALLLRRRGVEPTIYLGAKLDRETDAGMLAHAWLRAGERYVAGGDGAKAYGTLIAYSRSGSTD